MRALIIALLIAIGATAPAHACRIAEDAPPPAKIFWDEPPTSLKPGEVVLKVRYSRGAMLLGDKPDTIVLVFDCASRSIFSVVETSPLTSAVSEIIIIGRYNFGPRPSEPQYVVGKLAPRSNTLPDGYRVGDTDASAWPFTPRVP